MLLILAAALGACSETRPSLSRRSATQQVDALREATQAAQSEGNWLRAVALLELGRRIAPEQSALQAELAFAHQRLRVARELDEVSALLDAGAQRAALARLLVLQRSAADAHAPHQQAFSSPERARIDELSQRCQSAMPASLREQHPEDGLDEGQLLSPSDAPTMP